jgi:hypothetical protein
MSVMEYFYPLRADAILESGKKWHVGTIAAYNEKNPPLYQWMKRSGHAKWSSYLHPDGCGGYHGRLQQ